MDMSCLGPYLLSVLGVVITQRSFRLFTNFSRSILKVLHEIQLNNALGCQIRITKEFSDGIGVTVDDLLDFSLGPLNLLT